jgi:hypothetical protein
MTAETGPARAWLRELVLIYLMALMGSGYFVGTWQDSNTLSRLSLVWALVEEHRFEIDTTQQDDQWRDFLTQDRSWYNGHFYSDKAIGSSLVGAALWAPIDFVLRSIQVPATQKTFKVIAPLVGISAVSALLAPLIYAFVSGLAGGRQGFFTTIALMFGTALFKYSTGFYGHVLAGLLLFASFLIWFQARQRCRITLPRVLGSTMLLGFMIVTEYPTAMLALVLGGYMLAVLREQKRLYDWRVYLVGVFGFLLAVSPLVYYNLSVYGDALTTGYQHHATARFAEAHSHGLAGIGLPDPVVVFAMTFHPLMGIFWQSPVLLLAFVGWWAMRATPYREEFWFSACAIAGYTALISGYYEWSGGLSYTPRHLIPLYPLFAVPLAFLPSRWKAVGWPLAGVSIVQQLIAVMTRFDYVSRFVRGSLDAQQHPTTFWTSAIWNICWENLRAGLLLKNRGMLFMPRGYMTLLPLLCAEAVLGYLVVSGIARRETKVAGFATTQVPPRP